MSTSTAAATSAPAQCPCCLTQNELREFKLVGDHGVCTAYKKGSNKTELCGELFVDHPTGATDTVGSAVDPYLAEALKYFHLSRLLEEQKKQHQSHTIIRQVRICDFNVALLRFVLDTTNGEEDGGIRKYLACQAKKIGVTGFVQRNNHKDLNIRYDGTAEQVGQFQAVLVNLIQHGICSKIRVIAPEIVRDYTRLELSDFFIYSNVHGCCERNPLSDGARWEKNSSSVSSNGSEFMKLG